MERSWKRTKKAFHVDQVKGVINDTRCTGTCFFHHHHFFTHWDFGGFTPDSVLLFLFLRSVLRFVIGGYIVLPSVISLWIDLFLFSTTVEGISLAAWSVYPHHFVKLLSHIPKPLPTVQPPLRLLHLFGRFGDIYKIKNKNKSLTTWAWATRQGHKPNSATLSIFQILMADSDPTAAQLHATTYRRNRFFDYPHGYVNHQATTKHQMFNNAYA